MCRERMKLAAVHHTHASLSSKPANPSFGIFSGKIQSQAWIRQCLHKTGSGLGACTRWGHIAVAVSLGIHTGIAVVGDESHAACRLQHIPHFAKPSHRLPCPPRAPATPSSLHLLRALHHQTEKCWCCLGPQLKCNALDTDHQLIDKCLFPSHVSATSATSVYSIRLDWVQYYLKRNGKQTLL